MIGWLDREGSWEGTEGHRDLPTKTSETTNRKFKILSPPKENQNSCKHVTTYFAVRILETRDKRIKNLKQIRFEVRLVCSESFHNKIASHEVNKSVFSTCSIM